LAGRRRVTVLTRRGRLAAVVPAALVIAGLIAGTGGEAAPPPGKVDFAETSLFPSFRPNIHDYVVRCHNGPVTVDAHTSGGWEAAIGNHPFRSGDFSDTVATSTGRAFQIRARQAGSSSVSRYHVRCLPNGFPTYSFTRQAPVSRRFFSVDQYSAPRGQRYAMIFDDHGVPIWWYHALAWGSRVLPDGTVLWFDWNAHRHEVHRLDGSLIRTLSGVGRGANPHDLQVLGNGDHLIGSYVKQSHVDTSAYGGSSDANVVNAELQQVSPARRLVWDWKSQEHIALSETGRHWSGAISHASHQGYDIAHWNSIEPAGDSVIASFRQLDAVYKIRKSTGNIVWKLGGTTTAKSLTVVGDPHSYTLGAQHDARLLPDGTLTVFDNRSNLSEPVPEAVRFRIDERTRTATLLQSVTDPDVGVSRCCGSARRLANGEWLIDWGGQNNPIGGYRADGTRSFLLTLDGDFSYRAEPVPAGALSAQDLRQGMSAIYPAP
jgi:arylsulfotransferase ASST